MSDVNLSKLIRDYHGKHPNARPKEIAIALLKKGHEVSNTYVSLILFKLRTEGQPGPVGRPRVEGVTPKAPKAKAPKAAVKLAKAPKAKIAKVVKPKRVATKAKEVFQEMELKGLLAQQLKLVEGNIEELNRLRERLDMVEAKAQEAMTQAQA
jgi:hypothetical protein